MSQSHRCWFVLLSLVGCGGPELPVYTAPYTDQTTDGLAWMAIDDLGERAAGLVTDGTSTWALVDDTVWVSTDNGSRWAALTNTGLADGHVLWLGLAAGVLFVEVDGHDIHRWTGTEWAATDTRGTAPLLSGLNPRARPVPYGASGASQPRIAAMGALLESNDNGETWKATNISPEAGTNLLFSDVLETETMLVAAAFQPLGLLPLQYSSLLSGSLFSSIDGGTTWTNANPHTRFRYPTGLTTDETGTLWVATLDHGLMVQVDNDWTSTGGPSDTLDVSVWADGVSVVSATRGVWRLESGKWTGTGDHPMVGLTPTLALAENGTLYRLQDGTVEAETRVGDATVHVALSFHVNLYHSYRGDSNTDDGYGIDLDVMRNTLDWLDAHPAVRADWDIENHFSLGDWMRVDGADVLARIQARVAAGVDEVRPMSWNNGAMANHTEVEFKESMNRAKDSLNGTFQGFAPGVQPQECMFTADHIRWYQEVGMEWVTLFYSGTPFTALRFDHTLPSSALYQPFDLTDPDDDRYRLTTVPVYHHADMVNHGGLAGWARQIHTSQNGDQLLVIHLDADSETWESFEAELAELEPLNFVQFTRIHDYVTTHAPTLSVPLVGDTADGTGDGFQSWAEKDFNHELATTLHLARETARHAEVLAADNTTVARHLAAAMDARLLTLSTTHFGLASPTLHPDRIESAWNYADTALAEAETALELARDLSTPAAGEVRVTNTLAESGKAIVRIPLEVPYDDYSGINDIWLARDGVPLAARIEWVSDNADSVSLLAEVVLDLPAEGAVVLQWGADGTFAPARGDAGLESLWSELPIGVPFTECAGETSLASAPISGPPRVDARNVVSTDLRTWDLPFCGQAGPGALTWTAEKWQGFPGIVWWVDATLPDATGGTGTDDAPWNLEAESVVLAPIVCGGIAKELTWRTMGGSVRSRPVRPGQETWNGQATDSWVSLHCADDTEIQVSHDATVRTSLAFAPLRTTGETTLLAPLGTLWGRPVRHDVRRTGGHGAGDVITAVVGSQFRPAAPDWSGQAVRARFLVGTNDEIDAGTMALFAHPPLVQVGALASPTP